MINSCIKNIILFAVVVLTSFLLLACQSSPQIRGERIISSMQNTDLINGFRSGAAVYEVVYLPQRQANIIKINGTNCHRDILSFSLAEYSGKMIAINFSADVMRIGSTGHLNWHMNNEPNYTPVTYIDNAAPGVWHQMRGMLVITPEDENSDFYLTTWRNNSTNTIFYIDNLSVVIEEIIIDASLPALHTKWSFPIGTLPGNAILPQMPQNQLLRHFNILTAIQGPMFILPDPWTANGAYRWQEGNWGRNIDEFLDFADENNMKIRGHVLFWHQYTPESFFRGSGRNGWATIDELYSRMEHHARTVFQKHRGRTEWWDVVNEAVAYNGRPHPAGAPNRITSFYSPYTLIMEAAGKRGMDRYEWVLRAFQFARQHADANGGQNVKLYLNETNLDIFINAQNEFLRLLDYLIANNAPIDGVGIQGHYYFNSPNVQAVSDLIDLITIKINPLTGRNLTVQITELDISLFAQSESNWENPSASRLRLSEQEYNERLSQQTVMYRQLLLGT